MTRRALQRVLALWSRLRASTRTRRWAATLFVVAGFASLLLGIVNGFIRVNVYETQPFAENAAEAFQDESVKQVIAEKLTDQVLGRLPSFAQDVEPLLELVVYELAQTSRFAHIFREAAIDANRVFFDKESGAAALDLSDVGPLIEQAVLAVDPSLADALPDTLEGLIVEVSGKEPVTTVVHVAEDARDMTFLWPSLGIGLFALAIAVAGDRRRTVIGVGLSLAASGLLLAIGAELLGRFLLAGRASSTETDAAQAALDAYLADAPLWGLVLGLAGAILAAAAVTLGDRRTIPDRLRAAWALAGRRPARPWFQVVRALTIGAVGALVILEHELAITILAVAIGFVLLLAALTEIMRVAERASGEARTVVPWLVAFASVIGLVIAGVLVLHP